MASLFYNAGKVALSNGTTAYSTDTIKVALTTSAYTPNIDTDDFFNDVTNEIVGAGYTAGGATLASKTITQDNVNNRAVFDAADTTWTTSTITNARYAILYKSTGTPATSQLLCYIDLLVDRSTAGDTFKIEWDSTGIFYL